MHHAEAAHASGACIRAIELVNAGARGRLKALDAELEELRNQQAELNAQWERERSSMTKLTQIKEEVERVNLEVQQARPLCPFHPLSTCIQHRYVHSVKC
jgi:septal ring factor EnvC (AmiA/AmiB activator)